MPNLQENSANQFVSQIHEQHQRFTFITEVRTAINTLHDRLRVARELLNQERRIGQCCQLLCTNEPHWKIARTIARLEITLGTLRVQAIFANPQEALDVAERSVYPLAQALETWLQKSQYMTIAPETEALMSILRLHTSN